MIYKKQKINSRLTADFKADRPHTTVPIIEKEFTRDGKRMYLTTDGKEFDADIYDRNFKVTKSEIKPYCYKGEAVRYKGRIR